MCDKSDLNSMPSFGKVFFCALENMSSVWGDVLLCLSLALPPLPLALSLLPLSLALARLLDASLLLTSLACLWLVLLYHSLFCRIRQTDYASLELIERPLSHVKSRLGTNYHGEVWPRLNGLVRCVRKRCVWNFHLHSIPHYHPKPNPHAISNTIRPNKNK